MTRLPPAPKCPSCGQEIEACALCEYTAADLHSVPGTAWVHVTLRRHKSFKRHYPYVHICNFCRPALEAGNMAAR